MEAETIKKIDRLIGSRDSNNNLLALQLLMHVVGYSYEKAMLYFLKDLPERLTKCTFYIDGKDLLCTKIIRLDFGPFILKYGLSWDGIEHQDMDYFIRRFIVQANYKDDFEQLLQQPLKERIWGQYKGQFSSNCILLERPSKEIGKKQIAAYFKRLEAIMLEDYSTIIGLLRKWVV